MANGETFIGNNLIYVKDLEEYSIDPADINQLPKRSIIL